MPRPSSLPLGERETPQSQDVADAISQLVANSTDGLPVALAKADILGMMIIIAHTAEDGTVMPVLPANRRALHELYSRWLETTSIFRTGYKLYEKNSTNPTVPVTQFFFEFYDTPETLATMSDYEVLHSLPARPSNVARNHEGGDFVYSGEIAGIVVFPANYWSPLLRAWLERLGRLADGQLRGIGDRSVRAQPDSEGAHKLQAFATRAAPKLVAALPELPTTN